MLGFKSMASARASLGGIEMVHMIRKGQAKYACNSDLSLAEQFERLAMEPTTKPVSTTVSLSAILMLMSSFHPNQRQY